MLLLLSRFSRVWFCVTPDMAAHQAPPSLGFSRQEYWSGLPFPSTVHESEQWKVKVKSLSRVQLFATPWTEYTYTFPFSGYICPGVAAGSYGSSIFSFLFFFFLRIPILFSIVATSVYTPSNTVEVFPFSSLSHRDRALLFSLWLWV